MIINGIGPQAGASSIVGGNTLPSSPTFRQCFITPSGMYVALSDGSWSLLDSADAGTVSGSGVTNRLTKWIDGTGSVLGDSGVADDGTNILALRPFGTGFGLSTPTQFPTGARIAAASTISTSPRGIISAQFSSDTVAALAVLQKARGTVGTPVIITTGDILGQLIFSGFDGTSYLGMGGITCTSTGTIGTSRIPTTLTFQTATNANPSVPTTALTIGADQSSTFSGGPAVFYGDIAGAGTNNDFGIIIGQSAGIDYSIARHASDGTLNFVGNQATFSSFRFNTTGKTNALLISNAGAVSVAGTLTVAGITADTAHVDSTVCQDTTSHQFYSGTGAAGICLGTSSKRFKKNISDIKEGLIEVLKLRPRNFRYKKGIVDGGTRMQYGLVSEEVAGVMPFIVTRSATGELQSVDYGALWAIYAKAFQDLDDKLDACFELLNTRLTTLIAS